MDIPAAIAPISAIEKLRRVTKEQKAKLKALRVQAYEFNRTHKMTYMYYRIVAKVDEYALDVFYQGHREKEPYRPIGNTEEEVKALIAKYEAKGKWGKRWARFLGPW